MISDTDVVVAEEVAHSSIPVLEYGRRSPVRRLLLLLAWLVLAVFLAGLFATAVHAFWPERWTSSGQVLLPAVQKRVLGPDLVVPQYDLLLQTQVLLLQSERVLSAAAMATGGAVVNTEQLKRELRVERNPGSQIVEISFSAHDPQLACTVLTAMLRAYEQIHIEAAINEEDQRRKTLENRRLTLTNELRFKREMVMQLSQDCPEGIEWARDNIRRELAQTRVVQNQRQTQPAVQEPAQNPRANADKPDSPIAGFRAELVRLQTVEAEHHRIQQEIAEIEERLRITKDRLDELSNEFPSHARVIQSTTPAIRSDWNRSHAVTAAGAGLGFLVGLIGPVLFRRFLGLQKG